MASKENEDMIPQASLLDRSTLYRLQILKIVQEYLARPDEPGAWHRDQVARLTRERSQLLAERAFEAAKRESELATRPKKTLEDPV